MIFVEFIRKRFAGSRNLVNFADMREISTYIEQLLLHHDCVIVPGLGGFVVQDCPATYIVEEETFLPPYRNVSFSPRLTMNDGLLVQHIAQECHISYNEALHYIESEVATCRHTLDNGGTYTICGVGALRNSAGYSYEFTPLPCGILSPRHYGLDSIYAACIADEGKSRRPSEEKDTSDSFTLRIKMDYLRYVAVAAVLLLCYFIRIPLGTAIHYETSEAGIFQQVASVFMADRGKENAHSNATMANAQPASVSKTAEKPQAQPAKSTTVEKERPVKADDSAGKQGEGATESTAKAAKAEKNSAQPYHAIVLASAISHQGAESLVETMKDFGDRSAREYKSRSMTRVIYGNYADKETAQAALNDARRKSHAFDEAWVIEIKP